MRCYKCKREGSVRVDDKYFCSLHFCEIIEKRVRREIRINNLLEKNDKILILDDGSAKSEIIKYLLKKIIKDPTIETTIKKIRNFDISKDYAKNARFTKIIIPWLLDDEAEYYLASKLDGKKAGTFLHTKKILKPLINITIDEAQSFAKIKKLEFKPQKQENKDIHEMIERLDRNYPGAKFGILKTIRKTR